MEAGVQCSASHVVVTTNSELVDEPDVRAAGGVVVRYRRRRGRRRCELLIVHRPRYDDWTFAKGKRDESDSDDRACALREVQEETGFACTAGPELPSTRYRDHRGRDKLVRYWLMELPVGETGNDFVPNGEVDEIRWCDAGAAGRILTYRHDSDILEAAIPHFTAKGPS